jgi:hypothetical protein
LLYRTPPEELKKWPPPRPARVHGVIPVLIVAILLGLFALACGWMMITLMEHDKMRSCFAQGRHNCIPIPD